MAEQSVEVVKGLYEAFGRGDVPAVLGAMTEDIEWNEAEAARRQGRAIPPVRRHGEVPRGCAVAD